MKRRFNRLVILIIGVGLSTFLLYSGTQFIPDPRPQPYNWTHLGIAALLVFLSALTLYVMGYILWHNRERQISR